MPDPAAIRNEVLSRIVSGRQGWTATDRGWRIGSYDLIARSNPKLPYELWANKRCVAALMVPRDAVAVAECLAAAAGARGSSPERLFAGLSIPLPHDLT